MKTDGKQIFIRSLTLIINVFLCFQVYLPWHHLA